MDKVGSYWSSFTAGHFNLRSVNSWGPWLGFKGPLNPSHYVGMSCVYVSFSGKRVIRLLKDRHMLGERFLKILLDVSLSARLIFWLGDRVLNGLALLIFGIKTNS